jgi:hypothetical protein
MGLVTPPKVEKLRKALHAKAKEEAGFRFYQLYDKVYRADIPGFACRLCRGNGGAPGLEGPWASTAAGRSHRQLRGRLRYLLPSWCGGSSDGRYASDDGATEADGERGQDRSEKTAGGFDRLSGLHNRTVSLHTDGAGLRKNASLEEECSAHYRSDQRSDGASDSAGRVCGCGGAAKPSAGRLGQLLLLGSGQQGYESVDAHTRHRLRQWLRGKHKVANRGTSRYPDEHLCHKMGLVRLSLRTRDLPWAKA